LSKSLPAPAVFEPERLSLEDSFNTYQVVGSLVPKGSRVLDVGCGFGAVAWVLGQKGCSVIGVEPDPERRERAAEHCAELYEGIAETLHTLPIPRGEFDAVIFADVLEHLVDPWTVLRDTKAYLKEGGVLVISIPNVANFGARWNLLKGQFRYQDFGLYDRTHLRFFTKATLKEMIEGAGLEIVAWRYTPNLTETRLFVRTIGRISLLRNAFRKLDLWLTNCFSRLFAIQFVVACIPAPEADAVIPGSRETPGRSPGHRDTGRAAIP
jgi:2-polyprenyl-3-methyl-5-hydroxy-6-metoxy-1,4-benzoquinol methylase